ncbi:MAG: response regulator [Gemmataceae bacterium]
MFRLLGKINIAFQLMLLVAAVAGLAIFVVSSFSERTSKRLLLSRFQVGLANESQLQGYTLRGNLRQLVRKVNDAIESRARELRGVDRGEREAALRSLIEMRSEAAGPTKDRVIVEATLVQRGPDGKLTVRAVQRRQGSDAVPIQAVPDQPTNAAVGLLWKELAPAPGKDSVPLPRQRLSGLIEGPLGENGGGERSYLLAVSYVLPGDPAEGFAAVLVTFDFTRLVEAQARRLPRHLVFVLDAAGKWAYHPDPTKVGQTNTEWVPVSENSDEPNTSYHGCKDLKPVRNSAIGYYLVRQEVSETLARDSRELRLLETELLGFPELRFSRFMESMRVVALSSPQQKVVEQAQARLAEADRRASRTAAPRHRPVFCDVFTGQMTPPLPLDAEVGIPIQIILAGAEEEMTAEVHEAITQMWYHLFLPVLLIGTALALGAAYVLTRPLRRLTEASRRLGLGDYTVDVQVVAPGEVGELARTFREMANQIRTRERQQREQKEQMNTILNSAADGIIAFDHTGRIEQANPAAEEMFGYGIGGLTGTKVQKLMRLPDHLQKPPANLPPLSASSSATAGFGGMSTYYNAVKTPGEEHRGLRKDGTTFWMEVTFSQIGMEDRRLTIGIFRDVTQRKLAEERIREMNDELDARVQLRTAQLEDTKAKLQLALTQAETASAAKDRFISVVSHELRTPLTSAMGFTELLLNPRAVRLRENPSPTLEHILTACKHLATLINDLLDVGRYTAGKPIDLAPTRFDLGPFLRGVQEMMSPLVKKNGNVLETAIPPNLGEIFNDETRLRQILLNLLSNASKFTENGKVCLQVERDGPDWLIFRVSDTGAGMTAEQMEKLFTPFYRVDNSATRKQGGTGLGLAITKMICELMGGRITVESQPGQGSTFTMRLPAEVSGRGQRPAGATAGTDSHHPDHGTVLIIDDDATIRHLLETFLQQEGFRVAQAANGADGLRLARELQPTVITLDVLMPDEDGWDVLGRLKNDPATRDIPVIMLTIMEERNRGFALGATEYVTKPIDWGRLGSILCRFNPDQAPILIVEDDALQRGYLREGLALANWHVLEASNGAEALKVIEHTRPSLILLDLTMPIMDGFTFLDELRRREGGATIPVVVVTARELSAEERRKLNRSVAQVLAKETLAPEQLLELIRSQVSAREVKPS